MKKVTKQVAIFTNTKYGTSMVATSDMEILPDMVRVSGYVTVEFELYMDIESQEYKLQLEKKRLESEIAKDSQTLAEIDKQLFDILKSEIGL
jgi:hypothetical protein